MTDDWREVDRYDARSKKTTTHVYLSGSNLVGKVEKPSKEIWSASVGTSRHGNWFSKEEAVTAVKNGIKAAERAARQKRRR